jgi:O-antigen/teichoic acid export membrane protein
MNLSSGLTLRRVSLLIRSPRLRQRALIVAANSANSLLVPLLSPLFSFLVVRLASVSLWGDFVKVLVVAQLAAHVAGWGNKDYLYREFSRAPSQVAAAWQSSLFTRLGLFILAALMLAAFGYSPQRWALMSVLTLCLVLDQSYDVFVLYRRDFLFAFAVEVSGILLLALPVLWLRASLTVDGLIALFAVSNLFKPVLYGWRYRGQTLTRLAGRLNPILLRLSLSFFLIGLAGLLQSRVDLYVVSVFLPGRDVGQYQIYSNLVLYVQSAAALVLTPFVKGLYRLSYGVLLGLSARLFGLGLLAVGVGMPLVGLVLSRLYHLQFPPVYLLAGALLALPVYFYSPIIYAHFKANRQRVVVAVTLVGLLVSLLLNLWWLPRLGMLGAALAAASAQWVMGAVYLVLGWRLRALDAVAPPLDPAQL